MGKRKVCVVTGTRAEFGLMQCLIQEVRDDADLQLQIIATGMHLSPEFGLTYESIEAAGFDIDRKVEVLLSSDTATGLSKAMGLGMISFAEVYESLNPDIIVVLGDRFEIFAAVASAMVSRIPVAHIHGGEATEGLIDEPIRHSITKMSHLHFTATEEYARRVKQLGEQPTRVFNVGTPGLDNIERLELLDRTGFEESINFSLGVQSAMLTFHPVTLENNTAHQQFEELLTSLEEFPSMKLIFTMPNADTNGRIIINMIQEYVRKNPDRAVAFTSLGQLRYLSALVHVDLVIGNSSSGLTEAPSFNIPTINIGDRQKGRVKADTVIDCEPEQGEITEAINQALSPEFLDKIKDVKNPYGAGGASKKIKDVLKSYDLTGIIKKEFYDL